MKQNILCTKTILNVSFPMRENVIHIILPFCLSMSFTGKNRGSEKSPFCLVFLTNCVSVSVFLCVCACVYREGRRVGGRGKKNLCVVFPTHIRSRVLQKA